MIRWAQQVGLPDFVVPFLLVVVDLPRYPYVHGIPFTRFLNTKHD